MAVGSGNSLAEHAQRSSLPPFPLKKQVDDGLDDYLKSINFYYVQRAEIFIWWYMYFALNRTPQGNEHDHIADNSG
jgi:hypothetical protein